MQTTAIDEASQHRHLEQVSRTFALTIPLLPKEVGDCVSNAYLLCRIADTIEDDPQAPSARKRVWLKEFAGFANGGFADEMKLIELQAKAVQLASGAKSAELELLQDMTAVVGRTRTYPAAVRTILSRGVAILSCGMARSLKGVTVDTLEDVDAYCYFVAGVVGELLAGLFAYADARIDRAALMDLSVSFGEGLQLTNILKDRHEDAERGARFLPEDAATADGIRKYVAITKGHLDDALDFIQLLPRRERGIRCFCLLNICMAEATLRVIEDEPENFKPKISRSEVKKLYILCALCSRSNLLIKWLYRRVGAGLAAQRRDHRELRRRVSWWDKDSFNLMIEDKDA